MPQGKCRWLLWEGGVSESAAAARQSQCRGPAARSLPSARESGTHVWRYHSWSLNCVKMRIASSRKVATMRNLARRRDKGREADSARGRGKGGEAGAGSGSALGRPRSSRPSSSRVIPSSSPSFSARAPPHCDALDGRRRGVVGKKGAGWQDVRAGAHGRGGVRVTVVPPRARAPSPRPPPPLSREKKPGRGTHLDRAGR